MTKKNLDRKNRFRNITVGFRVSPEEKELLDRVVAISGLPKQEYCYRKCMDQNVIVQRNPRVYKAMKQQLKLIHQELKRISEGCEPSSDLQELIWFIAKVLQNMKEGGDNSNP